MKMPSCKPFLKSPTMTPPASSTPIGWKNKATPSVMPRPNSPARAYTSPLPPRGKNGDSQETTATARRRPEYRLVGGRKPAAHRELCRETTRTTVRFHAVGPFRLSVRPRLGRPAPNRGPVCPLLRCLPEQCSLLRHYHHGTAARLGGALCCYRYRGDPA